MARAPAGAAAVVARARRIARGRRLDFNVADALEAYHTEIVDIEAYAHAAGEAVTHLPHSSDPELRRSFARIYTLTSKVAADLNACVRRGDKLIAALSKQNKQALRSSRRALEQDVLARVLAIAQRRGAVSDPAPRAWRAIAGRGFTAR